MDHVAHADAIKEIQAQGGPPSSPASLFHDVCPRCAIKVDLQCFKHCESTFSASALPARPAPCRGLTPSVRSLACSGFGMADDVRVESGLHVRNHRHLARQGTLEPLGSTDAVPWPHPIQRRPVWTFKKRSWCTLCRSVCACVAHRVSCLRSSFFVQMNDLVWLRFPHGLAYHLLSCVRRRSLGCQPHRVRSTQLNVCPCPCPCPCMPPCLCHRVRPGVETQD